MNIYYAKKFSNSIKDQISAVGFGLMGDADLVSPSGDVFPLEYQALKYIDDGYTGMIEGKYIFAHIFAFKRIPQTWDTKQNYLSHEYRFDEMVKIKDTHDIYSRKWQVRVKMFTENEDMCFFMFRDEKIFHLSKYGVWDNEKKIYVDKSHFSENELGENGTGVILNFAPYSPERYDYHNPLFDAYFKDIEILGIADTPEELLILQAKQEGKTMTLEQAKEIAKDWHFGGVRQ